MLVVPVAGLWFTPGNELDDHDGLDRSMRCLACEVTPCNAEIPTPEAPALLASGIAETEHYAGDHVIGRQLHRLLGFVGRVQQSIQHCW